MEAARTAAVVGLSGFIGAAVGEALRIEGWTVEPVKAPRLRSDARTSEAVIGEARARDEHVATLADEVGGADVVINAAGVANPAGGDLATLTGANSLLPGVLARACAQVSARLIHISSAAVQGEGVLDESSNYCVRSAYARSKAMGEAAALELGAHTTVFRPTSVHGPHRSLTKSLARLARSPLATVVGAGANPTPQVLVENVAAAVEFVARSPQGSPSIVLQPWEGFTTASFLATLGGREATHVPDAVGRPLLAAARLVCRRGRLFAYRRRLELLWLGQEQVPGWLVDAGFVPPHGEEAWQRLAACLRG